MTKNVTKSETVATKPVKSKKSAKKATQFERTHFDVFSKSRGYLCTCMSEEAVHEALQSLYDENEKFWRRARSEGKKSKPFDCYGVARTGFKSRMIELQFTPDEDEGDTYEDAVERGNG